jgi:O-acetyl-ADP-ribose deacetylase (regulator of RNase III)
MKNKINYIEGDATEPVGPGLKIIIHICNDIGAWGAGFVLALSNKWAEPEAQYRALEKWTLGDVHFVRVDENTIIANMIAQEGIGPDDNGRPPIRYTALRKALYQVDYYAWMNHEHNTSIHMPRIGCGLAGGRWELVEELIQDTVECPVTVYDFN